MSNLLSLKSKYLLGVMIASAVAVLFAFAMFASTANAQTTVVSANEFTYSGVMKVGMSGPGISTLQAALNTVNTGVSTIIVDGKFGPATMGAVQRFQSSHGLVADGVVGPITGNALKNATASLIVVPSGPLCPNGMTYASSCTLPPGPVSAGPLCPNGNTLASNCTSGASGSLCPNGKTLASNCTSNSPAGSGGSGGETSITGVNVNDADDDSINEGANKAPVAQIEFDVDDADATLDRADIVFQAANANNNPSVNGGEDDPWRVFDNVYLMDGSKVVASVSSDSSSDWEDTDDIITGGTNQASRIRLTGIDKDYAANSNSNSLWVAVDVTSGVDGANNGHADWTVGLEVDGLRFHDGAGLTSVVDSTDLANFSVEESGAQSDFNTKKSTSSPTAATLEVKQSTTTENTIAIFKVDADADGSDVKINDFPVGLTLTVAEGTAAGTSNFNDVISDVFVTLDGTKYTGDYVANSCDASSATLADCTAGQTAEFRFNDIDDDDVILAAGDEMDVKVSVKFRSQGPTASTSFANGTTIQAHAQLVNNDVEDADSGNNVDTDIDGTADGEVMTLAGSGISVEPVSTSASVTLVDNGVTGDNDLGVFTIKVDITAFQDDQFISQDGATAFTSIIEDASDGTDLTPTTVSRTVSSTAETEGNSYRIDEGTTESFTFTITANPAPADEGKSIRAQLLTIKSGQDVVLNATDTFTVSATALSDYRTVGVVIPD